MRFDRTVLCLILLGLPAWRMATGQSPPPPNSGPARSVTCALSNPGYSGWCRVTQDLPEGITPRKLCADVLGCLNDVRCVKTYCNATTLRGGWKLEEVRTDRKKK